MPEVVEFDREVERDVERLEREFADMLWCLGLIDRDGEIVGDVGKKLSEISGCADRRRASLAKCAARIMDALDRLPE